MACKLIFVVRDCVIFVSKIYFFRYMYTGMAIAKPEIRWVLDITIAYPQGKPLDLPTIITGSRPPCETVLFYRVFPSSVVSNFDVKCCDTNRLRNQRAAGVSSVV